EAERLSLEKIQIFRQANPIVGQTQTDRLIWFLGQINENLAHAAIGEGMFKGVGSQFMDDQTASDGGINSNPQDGAIDLPGNGWYLRRERTGQMRHQLPQIRR